MALVLRRLAREGDRETFHGPEEAVDLQFEGEWVYLRCDRDTTARAARRRGFEDVPDEPDEPVSDEQVSEEVSDEQVSEEVEAEVEAEVEVSGEAPAPAPVGAPSRRRR